MRAVRSSFINRNRVIQLFIITIVFLGLLFIGRSQAQASPENQLRVAWENTERAGSYEFVTEMTETVHPAPNITSVGMSPKVSTIYVEGNADRSAETLTLSIWDDPSTIHSDQPSIDVKMDRATTMGRLQGGDWQEIDDLSTSFAPTGDAAMFLVAAKNVVFAGSDSRELLGSNGSVAFDKYTFNLDSDRYAEHIRATLQEQLQADGSLPAGLTLSSSELFKNMSARGEAWLDSNGLPLRMTVDMEFGQETSGERRFATVKTDFVSYNDTAAIGRIGFQTNLNQLLTQSVASTINFASSAAPTVGIFSLMVIMMGGGFALHVYRPKLFKQAFATTLSVQMAFAPLSSVLSNQDLTRFLDSNPHMVASAETNVADQLNALESLPDLSWATSLDTRIEQANRANEILGGGASTDNDIDNDNLSDIREQNGCLDIDRNFDLTLPTCSSISTVDLNGDGLADGIDTDGDGLTDGEEVLYLGTYPNDIDSDDDGLSDSLEVIGFNNGQFSNPLSADTDFDGRIDGVECSNLTVDKVKNALTAPIVLECENSDPSTSPDILTYDDDGDGVPSTIDLSPLTQIRPSGSEQFDSTNPLNLTAFTPLPNLPTLVDIQLRPINDEHLSFGLNYLDWPSGDREGQVQRIGTNTFGDLNGTPRNHPSHNGDMQIVPMLEVSLPGGTPTLPRALKDVSFNVDDQGRIVAAIELKAGSQETPLTSLTVESLSESSALLEIAEGNCTDTGSSVYSNSITSGAFQSVSIPFNEVLDGEHVLLIKFPGITYCEPLNPLIEGETSRSVTARSEGVGLTTVTMKPQGATDTNLVFSNIDAQFVNFRAEVNAGRCGQDGATLLAIPVVNAGDEYEFDDAIRLVDLANGQNSLTLTKGGQELTCRPLPNVVNGTSNQPIDLDKLAPYQISVLETKDNNLLAQVPLSLVIDDVTGQRVAFSGQMFFQSSNRSIHNATVNLVWNVFAITDSCGNRTLANCPDYLQDNIQIIHSYRDEAWRITGMKIEHQIDFDVAVIYEDPATDLTSLGTTSEERSNRSLEADDNLWHLAHGLQGLFLVGSDKNTAVNNPGRDYTIQTIKDIWDSGTAYTDEARLGIRADALNVEIYDFDSPADMGDLLSGDVSVNSISKLLNDAFGNGVFNEESLGSEPQTVVEPTLLFATEQTDVTVSLDSQLLSPADGFVTVTGATVVFDLTNAESTLKAGMSWKPFRHNGSTWEPAPIFDYLDELATTLKQTDSFRPIGDDTAESDGNLLLAQNYYLMNYVGRANTVEFDGQLIWQINPEGAASETKLSQSYLGAAKVAGKQIAAAIGEVADQIAVEKLLFARLIGLGKDKSLIDGLGLSTPEAIGRALRSRGSKLNSQFFSSFSSSNGKGFARLKNAGGNARAGALIISSIAVGFLDKNSENSTEAAFAKGMSKLIEVNKVVSAIELARDFDKFVVNNPVKGLAEFSSTKSPSGASKIAGLIGAFIIIGITIGAFISQVKASNIPLASFEFLTALSNTLGSALTTLFYTALSLTGIGAIIAIIIFAIDTLISWICDAVVRANGGLSEAATYVCKGISGLLGEVFAKAIFAASTDLIVTHNDPNRLQTALGMSLVDETKGFATGEAIEVSAEIQNNLSINNNPDISWVCRTAGGASQFNEANLRKSTFAYQFSPNNVTNTRQQLHSVVDMTSSPTSQNEWQEDDGVFSIDRDVMRTFTLPHAGINIPMDAYLVEAAQVPRLICSFNHEEEEYQVQVTFDQASIYSELGFIYDLFPPTLSTFYDLTNNVGGRRLAWGENSTIPFPILRDADGDGLRLPADKNDADADSDDDGVTDFYESQLGTNINNPDTDNDTIPDGIELREGTNPRRVDSDFDGLTDAEERIGWMVQFNVNGSQTRAWPNPNKADEDGDGLTDRVEKSLRTSPVAKNDDQLVAIESEIVENDAPLLLMKFDEPAQATAFGDSANRREGLYGICENDQCPTSGLLGAIGNAVEFDGTDDYISLGENVPEIAKLENNFTYAAWVNPSVEAVDMVFLGTYGPGSPSGFTMLIANEAIYFVLSGFEDQITPVGVLPANEWTHLAITMEDNGNGTSNVIAYINGDIGGGRTVPTPSPLPAGASPLAIGAYEGRLETGPNQGQSYQTFFFNGKLDEVAVFDYVLTEAQVEDLQAGYYNTNDKVLVSDQTFTLNNSAETQLLGVTADGGFETQLPSVISGNPLNQSFSLTKDSSGAGNSIITSNELTVNSAAPSGNYAITQVATSIVEEGEDVVNLPPSLPNASGIILGAQAFTGGSDYKGATDNRLKLETVDDFTIAVWINPDAVNFSDGDYGIIGHNSDQPDGYPALMLDGGLLQFGYAADLDGNFNTTNDVEWQDRVAVNSPIPTSEWTHVAVSYERANPNQATVFINGNQTDILQFGGPPVATGNYVEFGRTTAQAVADFVTGEILCEFDPGEPYYDLLLAGSSADTPFWGAEFVDDVQETNDRFITDIPNHAFTSNATFEMCENDSDDGNHLTCDYNDEKMGSFTLNYYDTAREVTLSTTPANPQCSGSTHYDDTIKLTIDVDQHTLPYEGSTKGFYLFKHALNAAQIQALISPDLELAHFRLNDPAGSTVFTNDVGGANGACDGDSCPLTGREGIKNLSTYFDGVDDYFQANDVSDLIDENWSDPSRFGFSFGAWIKPDKGFAASDGSQYILNFNTASNGNVLLVGLIDQGNDEYKIRVFDGSNNDSSRTLEAGEWHHVFVSVAEIGSNNIKVFIDGKLDYEFTGSNDNEPEAGDQFTVGMELDSAGPSDFFKGHIDDVIIWADTVDADDVQRFYQSAPRSVYKLDHSDRYWSLDATNLSCSVFRCDFYLAQDGVRVAQLGNPNGSYGNYSDYDGFDFPFSDRGSTFSIEFEFFIDPTSVVPSIHEFVVDETTVEGSNSFIVIATGFGSITYDYTVRSSDSNAAATENWLKDRPQAVDGRNLGAMLFNGTSTVGQPIDQDFPFRNQPDVGFTVMAWVKAQDIEDPNENFVLRPIIGFPELINGTTSNGYLFAGLFNGKPDLWINGQSMIIPNAIPANTWTHLAFRMDADSFEIFVNGIEARSTTNNTSGSFTFGFDRALQPTIGAGVDIYNAPFQLAHFSGLIDNVEGYDGALTNDEIAAIFNFQNELYVETVEVDFTVDNEPPTVALPLTDGLAQFVPATPTNLLITATDEHSEPASARLNWGRVTAPNTIQFGFNATAQSCGDADEVFSFCPQFAPDQEGQYYLNATVIDAAGNVQSGGTDNDLKLIVDGTAPVVTPNQPSNLFRPQQDPTDDTLWLIPLSGTVDDPNIDYGDNADYGEGPNGGSGVVLVTVQLLKNGLPVGESFDQIATLNGSNWSILYRIRGENISGDYSGYIVATDAVGNSSLTDIAGTTRSESGSAFTLDTQAPGTAITNIVSPDGVGSAEPTTYLNATTELEGTLTENPTYASNQDIFAGVAGAGFVVAPRHEYGSAQLVLPLANAVDLYLPFDKSLPPSSGTNEVYRDLVADRDATCSGTSCPQSGYDSPNELGLYFDGVDDALTISADTDIDGKTNDFMVAAWINPSSLSGTKRVVSSIRTNSTNGFGLGHSNGKLMFTTYGVKDYRTSGSYLEVGTWQHIAAYLTPNNDVEFYLNGVLVETVTHTAPASPNNDDGFMIGGLTSVGSTTPAQTFHGYIDSPMVASGELTGSDWDSIFGLQPTLHLTFDDRDVIDGRVFENESGMGTIATLDTNGTTDESTVGNVGVGALELTLDTVGVNITADEGVLPADNDPFTLSFWFDDSEGVDFLFDSSGQAGVVRFTLGGFWMHFAMNGITINNNVIGTLSGWHHATMVYGASPNQLDVYIDGVLVHQLTFANGTGLNGTATQLRINKWVAGTTTPALDDLRLYQRALTADEVVVLASSGWKAGAVTSRSNSAETETWTGSLPSNLEGYYDLFVRGTDQLGNVEDDQALAFSGMIDTKPPTVFVSEIPQGGGQFLYSVFAQDFAVDEDALVVPAVCTNLTTTIRQVNESPWLLGFEEQFTQPLEIVSALEVTCETSGQLPADAIFRVCDVANNCVYQNPDGTVVPASVALKDVTISTESYLAILTLVFVSLLGGTLLSRRKYRRNIE